MYCIQHCFICRPSDSTVSDDAGIEPRTVATSVLSVRRSNHSARSHHQLIAYQPVGEELQPGDGVEGVDGLELEPQVQVPHFDAAVLAPRHHALLHIPRGVFTKSVLDP
jgi:hypothetical protein